MIEENKINSTQSFNSADFDTKYGYNKKQLGYKIKENPYDVEFFKSTVRTRKGVGIKKIYKFYTVFKRTPIGVVVSSAGKYVKVEWGKIDKNNRIIEDISVHVKEVDRLLTIKNWCITDFLTEYPEYKYFIL